MEISSVHLDSQTIRAKELKFLEKVHLFPSVMCHVSHVMCHMSHVTCHMYFFWGGGETKGCRESVEDLLSTWPTPSSFFKQYSSWIVLSVASCSPFLVQKSTEMRNQSSRGNTNPYCMAISLSYFIGREVGAGPPCRFDSSAYVQTRLLAVEDWLSTLCSQIGLNFVKDDFFPSPINSTKLNLRDSWVEPIGN